MVSGRVRLGNARLALLGYKEARYAGVRFDRIRLGEHWRVLPGFRTVRFEMVRLGAVRSDAVGVSYAASWRRLGPLCTGMMASGTRRLGLVWIRRCGLDFPLCFGKLRNVKVSPGGMRFGQVSFGLSSIGVMRLGLVWSGMVRFCEPGYGTN